MVSPAGRRAQARYAVGRRLSCRRACALLGVPRSTLDYRHCRAGRDAARLAELRRLARRHPRYGYIVDEYTRECLAITVERSLPARRVLAVLARLVAHYRPPRYLRSDNGPEFIARRIRQWLGQTGVVAASIDPGKPWQNGVSESFHSRFRDECPDREWFHTPQEARVVIEQYRRQYNEAWPHSSLGYHTPAEIGARRVPTSPGSPPEPGRETLLAVT